MVICFTRWTAQCGCIFELESDPDSTNPADRENKFSMCDYICPKHEKHRNKKLNKLASNHKQKSDRILGIIERIKSDNLQNHSDVLLKHTPGSLKHKQIQDQLPRIHKHNQDMHEEWNNLVDTDHAFDEDLYNKVLAEHQFKDG